MNNQLSELQASTVVGESANDWLGWMEMDNNGNKIHPGVYYCDLQIDKFHGTENLILL